MEIQNGYGIGGPRVTGPVRVGDPLTLIIYMRSKYGLNDYYIFYFSIYLNTESQNYNNTFF